MGNMGMAARKLGDALESPGGMGKKTAQAMMELGVSLRGSMGTALEDTVRKLGAIEDPAKRAHLAFELFGRSGSQIAIVAENRQAVRRHHAVLGVGLNESVNDSLVRANAEIEAFKTKMGLLAAQATHKMMFTIEAVATTVSNVNSHNTGAILSNRSINEIAGIKDPNLDQNIAEILRKNRANDNAPGSVLPRLATASEGDAMLRYLDSESSKRGIDDRLAKVKADLANQEMLLTGDAINAHKGEKVSASGMALEKTAGGKSGALTKNASKTKRKRSQAQRKFKELADMWTNMFRTECKIV